MLVEYTSIHSLTAEEITRLKKLVMGVNLESSAPFMFEGKVLNPHELQAARGLWEKQNKGPNQVLLG